MKPFLEKKQCNSFIISTKIIQLVNGGPEGIVGSTKWQHGAQF